MEKNPYPGIAAVLALGVGLLIVGLNLPPEQHAQAVHFRWMGIFALLVGLLFLAIALSQPASLKALFAGIGATIFCGLFMYFAASNEITGTATWHRNFLAKHDVTEAVTRESSPAKFRTATNVLWVGSAVCFGAAVVSFVACRKLDE